MAPEDHSGEVTNLVLDALRDLKLEPGLVAHGRVDELRGGIQCYEFKAGKDVDAARLLVKERIRVYVVNTNHSKEEAESPPIMVEGLRIRFNPTQFLMELARLSKGSYIGLNRLGERVELKVA